MRSHPPISTPTPRPPNRVWLWIGCMLLMPIQAAAGLEDAKTALSGSFSEAAASSPDATDESVLYTEPRFFIEEISIVGGTRAAPDLLIAETRLESGRVYSERELRRALEHLDRLPFVLDSAMALRRGSQRGRYRLEIEVIETKTFFYRSEVVHTELGTPLRLDDGDLTSGQTRSAQLSGWRFFIDPYSTVFAALRDDGLQAGWTRYDLAGRGILLDVEISHQRCCALQLYPLGLDPELSSWRSDGEQRAQLTLGLPLKAQQGLRFSASYAVSDRGERQATVPAEVDPRSEPTPDAQTYDDRREVRLALTWTRDATDDPLLPTRGTALSAGLDFRRRSAELRDEPGGPVTDSRSQLVRASFGLAHHWRLSPRQSLAARGRLAVGRASVDDLLLAGETLEEDFEVWETTLALQHSLALWNHKMQRRFGDLRWENTVSWSRDDLSSGLEAAGLSRGHGPVEQWRLDSALVFRNAWGVMRIGLTYLDLGTVA